MDLPSIDWEKASVAVVLAFVVIAMITGWLIPKFTHDRAIKQAERERVERERQTDIAETALRVADALSRARRQD